MKEETRLDKKKPSLWHNSKNAPGWKTDNCHVNPSETSQFLHCAMEINQLEKDRALTLCLLDKKKKNENIPDTK